MSIRNTTLPLAALGVIAVFAVAHGAAAQGTTGKPTPMATTEPAVNPNVPPKTSAAGAKPAAPASPTPKAADAKLLKCPPAHTDEKAFGVSPSPSDGKLLATRVEAAGNEQTLICEYQRGDSRASVTSKVPASRKCVAVREGFNCN